MKEALSQALSAGFLGLHASAPEVSFSVFGEVAAPLSCGGLGNDVFRLAVLQESFTERFRGMSCNSRKF